MNRAFAVGLAIACFACASARDPIDPGMLRGAAYENAAFDLRVVPPPGWSFLGADEIDRGVGAEAKQMPSALGRAKAALVGTTTLFGMVDRTHAPAAGSARHAVLASAQRVPNAPAGLTSETIATELTNGLLALEMPIAIGARRQAIVADRRFVVVPTELEHDGVRGHLDHYLRYEPGLLLVLTVSYPPEETAPPQEAIESIRRFVSEASKGAP